ncbi:uncharacterized protein QYS62_002549 [Fusarium acuminatum]|uniref:RRM domain-containing protein n=1 Tax=Fusarium acuminatum TaxID=5515 RepID=A0ABZ2WLK2_9HYPO
MLFPEEDAPLLKAWIVKRIENTSDADADVLAEYVIALLKHDGNADAVRKLCEQEIPDFLSEDPKAFLDDVFQTIAYRSYLPGAPPAPKIGAEPETIQPSITESALPNGSRKRGFYDLDEHDNQDGFDFFNRDGRAQKQPRRGGPNAPKSMNPWAFPPDAGRGGRGGRRNRGSKKGGARAPFSADGPNHDRTKSTIVVENIPEESFSEEQVREFFSQFGNIQEISMQPYKHLAIVKYDKWGSANAAYQSPKVIFDNRFVKVFWYKDKIDTLPASAPLQGGNWTGDPMATEDEDLEPEIDMEEFQRKQEEEQKKHQEREAKRAEIEQKRQEIEKQQQELLARHREENERLQARLASQKGRDGDGNSSGTNMLRAKLAALEQEAKMLGLDPNAEEEANSFWPPRGGYRGRGGFRGRGAVPRGRGSFRGRGGGGGNMHAAYAQYSIDNRPKKIAITGVDFTAPEKDESLRHFLLNLGEFESVDTAHETTHVSFQDRKTAERFYYSLHGKELPGVEGRLDLAWVHTPLPPVKTNSHQDTPRDGGEDKEDDAMAGFDDQPRRERSAEPQQEDRAVNMDYEVAEEDTW